MTAPKTHRLLVLLCLPMKLDGWLVSFSGPPSGNCPFGVHLTPQRKGYPRKVHTQVAEPSTRMALSSVPGPAMRNFPQHLPIATWQSSKLSHAPDSKAITCESKWPWVKSRIVPVNIPIPNQKKVPNLGGEFTYPKMVPLVQLNRFQNGWCFSPTNQNGINHNGFDPPSHLVLNGSQTNSTSASILSRKFQAKLLGVGSFCRSV